MKSMWKLGIIAAVVVVGSAIAQESQPTLNPAREAVRAVFCSPKLLLTANEAFRAEIAASALTNAQKVNAYEGLIAFEMATLGSGRGVNGFAQAWAAAPAVCRAAMKPAAKAVLLQLKAASDAQSAALQSAADGALNE